MFELNIPECRNVQKGGDSGGYCPPEIFRVSYEIGSFLHSAGLGYLATIRHSLYLTCHIGGI